MKKIGLIGKKISYSFSKGYFSKKFADEKITDFSYQNIDIESIDEIRSFLENPDYIGFNVTIPYKEAIIPFLVDLSPEAKKIGAVNTLVKSKKGWIGHNTDWIGFWNSLKKDCQQIPQKALILGNGGASKAVNFALLQHDVQTTILARNPKKAKEFPWSNIEENLISSHHLIINTTPVGTFPDLDHAPKIPYHAIGKQHILFDLIYNPEKTLFLKKGEQQGATIINGYQMLVNQAEEAWKLWNNK